MITLRTKELSLETVAPRIDGLHGHIAAGQLVHGGGAHAPCTLMAAFEGGGLLVVTLQKL